MMAKFSQKYQLFVIVIPNFISDKSTNIKLEKIKIIKKEKYNYILFSKI